MTEKTIAAVKDEGVEKAVKEADVDIDEVKTPIEDEEDVVAQIYSQHGGDPRKIDVTYCVLLSQLPTDFMADTYEQFSECIRNLLSDEHKLDPSAISQIVRIPKIEADISETNAVRALLCFTEKTHKHRMMGRKKDFESAGMRVETLDVLPTDFLEFTDEDVNGIEEHNGASYEMADEVGEDEDDVNARVEEEEHGEDELEGNEMEYEEEHENKNEDEDDNHTTKDQTKEVEVKEKKDAAPKKKAYEDEDEKVEFETCWEGAPEFQWRIIEGKDDEKRLVIENMLFSDLQNVFMYRAMTRAHKVDIDVPTRYSSEGSKVIHATMNLIFSGPHAIMDEALKHLVYFRSPDGRRIKILLPQTSGSLKKKEDLEKKLGRLIKPTPRMKELVVKVLPANFEPTLDLACSWFPLQSVVGCELLNDEWGQPCAVIKFETAEEAIAAHGYKAIVKINTTVMKTDRDGEEKEESRLTNCNVYMRGVEAHFGSLMTSFDHKKKFLDEKSASKSSSHAKSTKRPAGSTIREPSQKKGRTSSPPPRPSARPPARLPPRPSRGAPRGGPRGAPRGGPRGGGRGPPPFVSRPRSPPGRRGPPHPSSRGAPRGRAPPPRSIPPRSSYAPSSSSSSSRPTSRSTSGFGSSMGYGYPSDRYSDRPSVDPFGRPAYGGGVYSSSAFARSEQDRYMELAYGSGISSLPDWTASSPSADFSSRRRH